VPEPVDAVVRAMTMAQEEDLVVITGSFRLLGPARAAVTALLGDRGSDG